MASELLAADLVFIGHMCLDEILPFEGSPRVAPGSAVLCGALAAARIGTGVAVVTRMAPGDEEMLSPLRQSGVVVHVIPSETTTYMRVVHPSSNVDEREMYQLKNAGPFQVSEIPALEARLVHLAGITDQEFDLEFVAAMKSRGYRWECVCTPPSSMSLRRPWLFSSSCFGGFPGRNAMGMFS